MNSKLVHGKYLAVLLLAIVALLLVAFDAFSATEASMEGSAPMSFETSQRVYRQERRYEMVDSTCTREVATGYHRECRSGRTERKCRKIAGVGEECWNETEEVCSNEPSYRTESYSCREMSEFYESVYDHDVDASFEISKTNAENFDLSKCKLIVSIDESREDYSARCPSAIVRVKVLERKVNGYHRDIKAELSFSSIEELNALKGGQFFLKYKNGSVEIGNLNLTEAKNFKLNVTLTRNRLLLSDKVLLNRDLKAGDYSSTVLSEELKSTSFNLAKLVDFDASKKHTLKVVLSAAKAVDLKGAINTPQLQNSISASLVINE